MGRALHWTIHRYLLCQAPPINHRTVVIKGKEFKLVERQRFYRTRTILLSLSLLFLYLHLLHLRQRVHIVENKNVKEHINMATVGHWNWTLFRCFLIYMYMYIFAPALISSLSVYIYLYIYVYLLNIYTHIYIVCCFVLLFSYLTILFREVRQKVCF